MGKKSAQAITVKKEDDFSEWYTQLIQKADLADYTSVSGCIAFKPRAYAVWEKIRDLVDVQFKKIGIQNAYFPLFIPEKLLQQEADHVEHFAPEVAWVTHGGNTKLGERLAIRPTSETIMYESYSKWIRSYNDLPLRLNQWNNVVRWEFKYPTPFLRTREFLWNEGHTVFATQEEAEREGDDVIAIYKEICEEYMALPCMIGKKSEKEKFAGAEYTISMEFIMPDGKGIQGPDFHHDGQNFAKAFDITYVDADGKKQHVWQNTFAITTRMLGVLFATHGDDKGLVLPPLLAETQVVIVPILFDETKADVVKEAAELAKKLEEKGISAHVDDRDNYSPGWKFNEWEMKGVPLRVEIGPKDLAKKQGMVVSRDTGEKQAVKLSKIVKEVPVLLEEMQKRLYTKAEKFMKSQIVKVTGKKEAVDAVKKGKIILAPWCGSGECEDGFKLQTTAKSLNEFSGKVKGSCFYCKKKATSKFYFGKSY